MAGTKSSNDLVSCSMRNAANAHPEPANIRAMRQLAAHWEIPLSQMEWIVGVRLQESPETDIALSTDQSKLLGCLREIDLTLLLLDGTDRRWLKKRNKAREFRGRAPIECIRRGDPRSASAVHSALLRRCARVPARSRAAIDPG